MRREKRKRGREKKEQKDSRMRAECPRIEPRERDTLDRKRQRRKGVLRCVRMRRILKKEGLRKKSREKGS